jgi:hypothetical protein
MKDVLMFKANRISSVKFSNKDQQQQLEKPQIPKVSIQGSISTNHLNPNQPLPELSGQNPFATRRQLSSNKPSEPNPLQGLSSFTKTRGKVQPNQQQQPQQQPTPLSFCCCCSV